MVIESLLYPAKAEKKPWEMFFVGFLYSSIAIFLSLWIFEKESSFVMVFLTAMACIPIVYNTMKLEEKKDMTIVGEKNLLKEHNKAIMFLMYLFVGITVSCALWYIVLPSSTISYLFEKQMQTIVNINSNVSGGFTDQMAVFSKIFLNNVKVLSFSILFAFIYGAGAIFILTWNATVIATAIGNFIRSNLGSVVGSFGLSNLSSYFQVVSIGLLKYSIHGIPEIVAYFYGGLAGGIISVAVMKHHFATKKFADILIDTSELILISIGFLAVAGLIEVYITPCLFSQCT